MIINGIGMVCGAGRGVAGFESALKSGGPDPVLVEVPGIDNPIPTRPVPSEALKDKDALSGMRRADRLSKMAVLAAWDAWGAAGIEGVSPDRVGIILATGLGPHVRTFQFLDGVLDFGDEAVSPTDFSHSVHNAAAGYVSIRLETHGPVHTLTDFEFSFHHGLELAETWLDEGRCDVVLLGAAEELGDVFLHVCARMSATTEGEMAVPGEGAVFFTLTSAERAAAEPGVSMTRSDSGGPADLVLFERLPGISREVLDEPGVDRRDGSVVFGHMATGSAFHCAAAAMMLMQPPNADDADSSLRTIQCEKLGAGDRRGFIRVELRA